MAATPSAAKSSISRSFRPGYPPPNRSLDANRQAFSSWKRDNGTPPHACTRRLPRIRERGFLQPMNDMGGSPALATKKLPASGKVVKRSRTSICVPAGTPTSRTVLNLASGNNDFGARFRARLASRQPESRDAGYAGQCLAAKTHRAHARKIWKRGGSCLSRDARGRARASSLIHAATVITHRHKTRPAADEFYPDFPEAPASRLHSQPAP